MGCFELCAFRVFLEIDRMGFRDFNHKRVYGQYTSERRTGVFVYDWVESRRNWDW